MKINVNGKMVEAEQVWPVSENEPWNEYQLENGDRLRMKTIAKKIFMIKGQNGQYIIHSQNILDADGVSGPEGSQQ